MKVKRDKLFSFLLVFLLVIGIFATPVMASGEKVNITILGTTDVHGNIYNWSYEDGEEVDNIGFAKIYSVVKSVREQNPNTLLIDNGDTIQGTLLTDDLYNYDLEKPNPVIDVMNFMGYDSMTLGNHEFNFGLDLVKKIEREAKFPILAANVYNVTDNTNYMKPYTVKDVAGVKVGILGLTNPNIPRWDGVKVKDLKFEALDEAADKYIKELKEKEKVDLIIVTAHTGLDVEYGPQDEARSIIENNPDVDVLLVGHGHITVNETIGNTVVGGARDAGRQVVRFDLELEKRGDTWEVVDRKVDIIEVEDYEASEELKEYAQGYHKATLDFISREIGYATEDLHPASEIKGIPEGQLRDTAVVDLINNVQLKYSGADISAAALFKNDANIKKGPITFADVFDIYKYPNTLKVVEVTGKELKDYMEWSAAYYNTYKPGDVTISFNPNIRGYKYDMFQGVDYKIDISKSEGERIVDLKFKGKPVKPDDKFKLAINDYRYSGLYNEGIIKGEPIFESDPISMRSYIAQYIEEVKTIEPKVDNNWEIIGADLDHPLRDYIINEVNEGRIEIPVSEDGRSYNAKALNVYELIEEGVIPEEVLKEYGIAKEENEKTEIATPPKQEVKEEVYIVKFGDVLWKIAKKFGTTWQRLAEFNKLKNPHLIFPGQRIIIPAN